MDLTSGLLKSNEAISQANPVGNYTAGYTAGQQARANATTNEKSRWELDNQEKLQKAISMSVDEDHNLVPELLLKNGHELGIDQQVLSHAVEYLPKQWEAIRKTAAEKNAFKATNPEGAARVEAAVSGQGDKNKGSDTSWMEGIPPDNSAATQSSTTATATPSTSARSSTWTTRPAQQTRSQEQIIADQTAAPSGFATPSKEGYTMDATNGMVGNAGVMKMPDIQPETPKPTPSKNIFQIANEMPAAAPRSAQQEEVKSPVVYSNLPDSVKKSIKTGMEQSGLLKAGATDEEIQGQIDNDVAQIMKKAVVPTSDQFIGTDGLVDVGAYNKAVAEYPAKQAALLDEVKKKYGAYYADQLSQKIAVEGNARAAQATKREQTKFDQTQSIVDDAHKQGYTLVTQDNAQKFQEVMGTLNGLLNSKKEIGELRHRANTLNDDEFNAQFDAFMSTLKGSENINSLAADDTFMANMRKDKTFGQIAYDSENIYDFINKASTNMLGGMSRTARVNVAEKLVEAIISAGQVKGKADAYKPKKWTDEPAKTTSKQTSNTSTARNPGESTADYLKRIRGR